MMVDEFKWIFLNTKLEHTEFSERTASCMLNLSMQTHIDEISHKSHLRTTFIEFIEALSRCAD